eukprot:TRINITY_DN15599_c0_g1_i1.p1 TRINITY_DN15599_c0_g1~~TRINITY_DN15599_c0_g1_i1.p1  ORF type:complete len:847 (-),score=193.78 TRINITY_DN15599_c0_g1_i1:23-2563(-)
MEGWRSEPMTKVHLFIQSDAAKDTCDELARDGVIEFIDLNADKSAFQRRFVNEVKRCDEMERKIRFFADQIRKLEIHVDINAEFKQDEDHYNLEALEDQFEDMEKDLRELAKGQEQLDRNYNELIESRHVLTKDESFFSEAAAAGGVHSEGEGGDEESTTLLGAAEGRRTGGLGFITGVILTSKLGTFERVIFRATRGNMLMKHADIEENIIDPTSGEKLMKTVFIVFFSGERSRVKIKKICDSYHANTYPCPDSPYERGRLREQLDTRIEDLRRVLDRTVDHRKGVLQKVALEIEAWNRKVKKEKALFHTLNMFNYDITRKALMAEAWVPTADRDRVLRALRRGTERSGAMVPSVMTPVDTAEQPPTYFKTTKYTKAFQDIIESYGIARYQEINPAVLATATFPFLFAVMFGDVAHGIIMMLVASLLIWKENQLKSQKLNEMVGTCFQGRYMIWLMGLFSIYTGLLYNEFFSRPMNLFWTAWYYPPHSHIAVKEPGRTYPFGVDPVWKDTQTELQYYNSLKMKMSVIFGVTHMMSGLLMKLLNAIHFKQWKTIAFEWIPEVLFMGCIFGYLVVMIFLKWFTDWTRETIQPPSLITMLIKMFLSPGMVPDKDLFFAAQPKVQVVLLLVAVLSLPVLLLPKPLLLLREHKMKQKYDNLDEGSGDEAHGLPLESQDNTPEIAAAAAAAAPQDSGDHGHGGEFNFSEVMVHQIIHTIEFALGTVSNTASYLRLWALSLAHSELANVFWQKILVGFISSAYVCANATQNPCTSGYVFSGSAFFISSLKIWVGAGAFFGTTMGVLMIMESLSAFLHALRLHWVEFQNKFYAGDGHKFKPFSYYLLLHPEDE